MKMTKYDFDWVENLSTETYTNMYLKQETPVVVNVNFLKWSNK